MRSSLHVVPIVVSLALGACATGVVVSNGGDGGSNSSDGGSSPGAGGSTGPGASASGGAGPECSTAAQCDDDADKCTIPACEAGACVLADVDPDDGDACTVDSCDPVEGVVHLPVDVDDGDACTVDSCDPVEGVVHTPVDVDDGDACTVDACDPVTGVTNVSVGFVEDFSQADPGWLLGPEWAIGPAVAGCGDPGLDHSPSADNRLAGVVIGGCATTSVHDYYCITSPIVDTTSIPNPYLSYWRDLYSDYTPYMKNKIEVWNGSTWVIVFETFGSPGVNDSVWTHFNYNLTSYSNPALRVRWCHMVGSGAFARGSWNIDDVVIGPQGCGIP